MKKLRVSHYPQIPCEAFKVSVDSLEEGKKMMDILSSYDYFQYKNNIKPDYSNMSTLEEWDEEEQEWVDWMDEETGIDNIDEYFEFIKSE